MSVSERRAGHDRSFGLRGFAGVFEDRTSFETPDDTLGDHVELLGSVLEPRHLSCSFHVAVSFALQDASAATARDRTPGHVTL
jgi:hypothetical protein